jgi:hypothetical protein
VCRCGGNIETGGCCSSLYQFVHFRLTPGAAPLHWSLHSYGVSMRLYAKAPIAGFGRSFAIKASASSCKLFLYIRPPATFSPRRRLIAPKNLPPSASSQAVYPARRLDFHNMQPHGLLRQSNLLQTSPHVDREGATQPRDATHGITP